MQGMQTCSLVREHAAEHAQLESPGLCKKVTEIPPFPPDFLSAFLSWLFCSLSLANPAYPSSSVDSTFLSLLP